MNARAGWIPTNRFARVMESIAAKMMDSASCFARLAVPALTHVTPALKAVVIARRNWIPIIPIGTQAAWIAAQMMATAVFIANRETTVSKRALRADKVLANVNDRHIV